MIDVIEVKPENPNKAVCVIDTSVLLDFAPPKDYIEDDNKPTAKTKG